MAFEHLSLYIYIFQKYLSQSVAVYGSLITVDFFYYHYINKNSFQKENLHYEIVAFLDALASLDFTLVSK